MPRFKRGWLFAIVWLFGSAACAADTPELQLPPGFEIEIFHDQVPGARSLQRSESGILFVSTREVGSLYALRDDNGDGRPDTRFVLAEGLNQPNGIAWRDGDLYVAEIDKLWRYPDIEDHLDDPQRELLRDDLPTATHHGWRYIAFGPDGKLYLSIGAPCNICEPETFERGGSPLQYGSITRMDPDGGHWEVYARGVRNSVGLAWDAGGELWFTDNGRDWLGDELPPGELNHASAAGQHFGYPYCHAGVVADPEFGKKRACDEFRAPARALGPHVAPLGLRFYDGTQFPEAYRGRVFIAEHGSWNRSKKIGYRVSTVSFDGEGRAVRYEPFAQGWLDGERVLGRPVDLLVMPDGALLVSDDAGGRIYRISYTGSAE